MSKGRADWSLWWGIMAWILYSISFYIGVKWNIYTFSIAYLSCSLLLLYPGFAIPFKLIELKFSKFAKTFYRITLSSLLMFGVVFGIKILIEKYLNDLVLLIILIPTGIISYGVFILLFNKKQLISFLSIFEDDKTFSIFFKKIINILNR